MIALPLMLQRLYPHARMVPERPWWKPVEMLGGNRFWRADGAFANTVNEAADIDQRLPMPKPHFRVGQVWAWFDADTPTHIVVMQITLLSVDTAIGEVDEVLPQRPPPAAFLLVDPGFTPWSPHADALAALAASALGEAVELESAP